MMVMMMVTIMTATAAIISKTEIERMSSPERAGQTGRKQRKLEKLVLIGNEVPTSQEKKGLLLFVKSVYPNMIEEFAIIFTL